MAPDRVSCMITNGAVKVDAHLHRTAGIVRAGLLPFAPRVAEMDPSSGTDETDNGVGVLVAGISRSAGYGPADLVRRLRLSAPALCILLVAKRGELSPWERERLAFLGVDRILLLEHLDSEQLSSIIRRRLHAPAPERAMAALALIPLATDLAPMVQWTLRNACFRPSIEHVAELFWLSSRTVRRRLADSRMRGQTLTRRMLTLVTLSVVLAVTPV